MAKDNPKSTIFRHLTVYVSVEVDNSTIRAQDAHWELNKDYDKLMDNIMKAVRKTKLQPGLKITRVEPRNKH